MNHWYDNTISQGILKEKFYHKGEKTPQEFMDRVSSIFDPELKKRIRGYLEDTSFCPAGRTLYAAGAKGNGEPKPPGHLGGQDLQLNFAHELDV